MYAIIEVQGKQYKVQAGAYVYVPHLALAPKKPFKCQEVLMVGDEKKATYGCPHVKGASVSGRVLAEVRDDKVVVFKKKRRKGYQSRNGHRQTYTKIIIDKIHV